MPQYLRNDAVRLFEASMETLQFAIVGLGLPYPHGHRQDFACYAPVIGLLDAAVEQAMSACLIHIYGSDAILKTSTMYKTGREILHDFRAVLRNPVPRAAPGLKRGTIARLSGSSDSYRSAL
jgi:hypothetical protein